MAKILALIAKKDINLSKLQSFPLAGSQFKYGFHADLEFDSVSQFNAVIKKIDEKVKYLRVLGVYKKGKFNS